MGKPTKHNNDFTWKGVPILKYKEEGTHFKAITRQVLFAGQPDLPGELRYFEIAPQGYSTLERHKHVHVVMVIRGAGKALVGSEVLELGLFDVVQIPTKTWHQFQANDNEAFGFLCLVHTERDRPERPTAEQVQEMKSNQAAADFIKI